MAAKSPLLSKTLWFNVLALVVAVSGAFGYIEFIPDEHIAEYSAAIITVINVVLRVFTNQGITLSK